MVQVTPSVVASRLYRPEVASLAFGVSVTAETYQPFCPVVPVVERSRVGAVVSTLTDCSPVSVTFPALSVALNWMV